MVFVSPYFQKLYLIAFFDIQTNIFKFMFYRLIKHRSSVLRWKYQVIQQDCNIVTLMNIFTYSPIFAASCGEYNPQRFNLARFCIAMSSSLATCDAGSTLYICLGTVIFAVVGVKKPMLRQMHNKLRM